MESYHFGNGQIPQAKLGWIPYWNLWPLRCELVKHGYNFSQIMTGDPSQVNKWLHEGKINVAPCSSICLIKNAKQEMALPLGVASDGPVRSVYLGFNGDNPELYAMILARQEMLNELASDAQKMCKNNIREFAQYLKDKIELMPGAKLGRIPIVKMSQASESSVVLTRLLFQLWFPKETCQLMQQYEKLSPSALLPEIELVIGDEALARRNTFTHIIDLGALWRQMTGLPFVYAVWQANVKALKLDKKQLLELAEIAENRMHIEPTYYIPTPHPKDTNGEPISLADYWKNIYYRLGNREIQGLITYLCLARCFDLVETNQSFLSKIIRWQTLTQGSASTYF